MRKLRANELAAVFLIVYYFPRPRRRILHSRVDFRKHANMISYFPAEVRILFFFMPWLESSPKHARFADGKLQVIITSYTENTWLQYATSRPQNAHVLANFRPGYDEKAYNTLMMLSSFKNVTSFKKWWMKSVITIRLFWLVVVDSFNWSI